MIIVTHDMQIARHAGRIIELRDGEVIADSGSTAPLPKLRCRKTPMPSPPRGCCKRAIVLSMPSKWRCWR